MACPEIVKINGTFHQVVGNVSGSKAFGGVGTARFELKEPLGLGGWAWKPVVIYDPEGNIVFTGTATGSAYSYPNNIRRQSIDVTDATWFLVGHALVGSFGGVLLDAATAAAESSGYPYSVTVSPNLGVVTVPEITFEGGLEEILKRFEEMAGARYNINHITGAIEFFKIDMDSVPLSTLTLPLGRCDRFNDIEPNPELTFQTADITRVTFKGVNSDIRRRYGAGFAQDFTVRYDIPVASLLQYYKLLERTTRVQSVYMWPAEGPPSVPYWTAAIDPSTRTIVNDGCVAYTVTITPHLGFTGVIDLNAVPISGLPTGVSYSFTPDTVTLGAEQTSELQICTDEPIDCCEPGTFSYFITDIDCSAVPSDCCALPFYPDQVAITWTVQYYDTCGNLMSDDSGVMVISRDENCAVIENGENTFSNPYTGITYSVLDEGPANCRCVVG